MRERGFLPVGLLASPTLWLGIGCAALAFSSFMLYRQWVGALEREAKARGEYAAFRAETNRLGEEAKAAADAKMKKQQEVNDALSKKLRAMGSANAELRAHVERLRARPIERPDGSSVPVTAVCPGGVAGSADDERVPLADYRSLEARAAYDAQTVMLWREWATGQGLMR